MVAGLFFFLTETNFGARVPNFYSNIAAVISDYFLFLLRWLMFEEFRWFEGFVLLLPKIILSYNSGKIGNERLYLYSSKDTLSLGLWQSEEDTTSALKQIFLNSQLSVGFINSHIYIFCMFILC